MTTIQLTVTDATGLSASTSFDLTVTSLPDAPTITGLSTILSLKLISSTYSFTVSDADGDEVTVTCSSSALTLVSENELNLSDTTNSEVQVVLAPGVPRNLSLTIQPIASKMRYNNGIGYFWINNMGKPFPKMIMHPTVPSLNSVILDDEKYNCALGIKKNLFQAMVEKCEEQNEGFVDYMWPKPSKDGLTAPQPKLSYVKLFKSLNWVIGTGVYIDDIDDAVINKKKALNEEIQKLIKTSIITIIIINIMVFFLFILLF
jgi:Signal transduction histidine kinase